MAYRIRGLAPDEFTALYGLPDTELKARGVTRYRVDEYPGFPDRVTMQDMQVGDTALLLNHEHMDMDSPYRARHAIFVREGAQDRYDVPDVVPDVLKRRIIALRGYDARGFIIEAEIAEGDGIEPLIHQIFANPKVAFIHAHNAKRGCYAGLIERD